MFGKLTREGMVDFIKNKTDQKLKTLDLGCGSSPYQHLFDQRIGFDIFHNNGVDVVGDIHKLPFSDGEFEQILCTEVLEHSHSPWAAIKEMHRVLKKGGKLVLTTRFLFPHHDTPHDYYRFTQFGLENLFSKENGWNLQEMDAEASTQESIGILIQRMAFQGRFIGGRFTIFVLHVIAKIIFNFPNLLKIEFGDIKKSAPIKQMMSTGYYIVAERQSQHTSPVQET